MGKSLVSDWAFVHDIGAVRVLGSSRCSSNCLYDLCGCTADCLFRGYILLDVVGHV